MSVSTPQQQSDHKDRLIVSLKQECVESHHRERNYTVLYE